MRRRTVVVVAASGLAWIVGLAVGFQKLIAYQKRPGPTLIAPFDWPADAPPRNTTGYTLAVFLHPECPCSTATVDSLNQIMAHADGKVRAYVFAELPDNAPANWQSSPLIASAQPIPGVTLVQDHGHLAREFGALTSGHTELFNNAGTQVFYGGITAGRGHQGDNAGLSGIESIVAGHLQSAAGTPVFGCALFDSSRMPSR